jgi:hypothetical protein
MERRDVQTTSPVGMMIWYSKTMTPPPPFLSPFPPFPALYYDASEQGDCLLARLSLDMTLLAVQRSRHTVEVRACVYVCVERG